MKLILDLYILFISIAVLTDSCPNVQLSIHRIPISSFLFGIVFNKISTLPNFYMSFIPSAGLRFFNSLSKFFFIPSIPFG